jgi:hypothetical protein
VATLLSEGVYSRAAKVSMPHPNVFALPLVQALLHASLSQANYSGGDCGRSIAFLQLGHEFAASGNCQIVQWAESAKMTSRAGTELFGVSGPFFMPQKSQKSRLAVTRAILIEDPIAGVILKWLFSGGGQHDGVGRG